jgi:hypothetical protein
MNGPTTDRTAGEAGAWIFGSGILLIQACAVIPGLLPCLLLLLPFVLPFVVLGVVLGLPVALLVGIWRLSARGYRALRGRSPRWPDRQSGARLAAARASSGDS